MNTAFLLMFRTAVTGHRSWHSLQRYTHVRQTTDRLAGWKWLAHVTGG